MRFLAFTYYSRGESFTCALRLRIAKRGTVEKNFEPLKRASGRQLRKEVANRKKAGTTGQGGWLRSCGTSAPNSPMLLTFAFPKN
jgi:hypothetical protein